MESDKLTPVADATVTIGNQHVTTNAEGYYVLTGLEAGSYTVTPFRVGYAFSPTQRTVEVTGDARGNGFVGMLVPSVTAWTPQGSAVPPTEPIEVSFSRPMDRGLTRQALAVQEMYINSTDYGPALPGTLQWNAAGDGFAFLPTARLKAYRSYRVRIAEGACSLEGAPIASAFEWSFQTSDALAVVSSSPTGRSVGCNASIVVGFDRDVNQASVVSAFSLNPFVPGAIEWVNPRTVQFIPVAPLAFSTEYTVTVASGAQGLDGIGLHEAYSWGFTTQGPTRVLSATPSGAAVPLSAPVVVTFDRPMNRSVTQHAFSLTPVAKAAAPVAGTYLWNDRGTELTFRPGSWLSKQTEYAIKISTQAISGQGAPLAAAFEGSFTTADSLSHSQLLAGWQ